MEVQLINKSTGATETTPMGFSWTCFFFFGLVPIIRGDWGTFFKLMFLYPVTLGIYHFIYASTYNRDYAKRLIMMGYTPANDASRTCLQMNGVYINS